MSASPAPSHGLLAALSEGDRRAILQRMQLQTIPEGVVFAAEGEPGSVFYVIEEGEVEVIKALGTAEERLLGMRAAGDFIGEGSLFTPDCLRSASLRTCTPVRLLEMTHENFSTLLHERSDLAYEVARTISLRQAQADNDFIRTLQEKNRQLTQAYTELKAAHVQIVEKEKLEKELQVAHTIQNSILPQCLPAVPGYSLGARMQPARAVGGDLYDFIPLEGGRLGVLVGDVSDKGVPAAIFMGLSRSLVRAEAVRSLDPSEVCQRVNAHLLDMNHSGMFVTVLYGVLDPAAGQFYYARAGHELPIVYDSQATWQPAPLGQGMMLGIFQDPALDLHTVALSPGGVLLLHSDGATDLLDPAGESFGHERLRALAARYLGQPAQAICDAMLDEMQTFQADAAQADDITLVVVSREG